MYVNRSIFIVEDNDSLRSRLCEWLRIVFPNHTIIGTGSAEKAIPLILERHPQVVIMDLNLPGKSGIDATQELKESIPGIKVVMISIHEGQEYQRDALAAGVHAYIFKSQMHTHLIPAINELIYAGDARQAAS